MMNIVVDIGLGYIKAKNDKGDSVSFPSVIAEKQTGPLMSIYNRNSDYLVTYCIGDREVTLCVGESAINNMGKRKEMLDKEDLICFLMCAIGIIGKEEKINLLVVLPKDYTAIENQLIDELSEKKVEVVVNGENKKMIIKSIQFFPESIVGYYNHILQDNKINYNLIKPGNSIGIIDIGYNHVKYLIMTSGKEGIKRIDNLSGKLENKGIKVCYKVVYEGLGELKDKIDLEDVEESIVKNNCLLEYKRGELDLTSESETAYSEYVIELEKVIKHVWGIEKDLLSKLIITGGAVNSLREHLEVSFNSCEIEQEGVFHGCDGGLAIQDLMQKIDVGQIEI